MVTTVAPTIPVLAASNMPISVTEIPSPPRRLPRRALIVSSKSSAMRARSSVTPMKTNKGTATSISLVIIPNRRLGSPNSRASLKLPPSTPRPAKISAVPPSDSATGKPASSTRITTPNSSAATHSTSAGPQCANAAQQHGNTLQSQQDWHHDQYRLQ